MTRSDSTVLVTRLEKFLDDSDSKGLWLWRDENVSGTSLVDSYTDMDVKKTNYQAFFQRRKVWNFQGKLRILLMVNAEKWGAKIKKWERCQRAIA